MSTQLGVVMEPSKVDDSGGSPALRTTGITKSYGHTRVLEELSLEVGRGEFVSLLGPSGCGKTTTLNIVSGFVAPDAGRVHINDRDVTNAPAHKRDSSVVFQNYALFPHLTVEKNIRYGLKAKRLPGSEVDDLLKWALKLVAIEDLASRYPGQLSGGQQQRVAVARSLVMQPGILLMDEPLSNLDAKLRAELRLELKTLQQNLGQSVLFVTHDQVEALSLSDRIVVMNKGHVEQVGNPKDVYTKPATVFVAKFMGVENVFEGEATERGFLSGSGMLFPTMCSKDTVAVGIRPSSIRVSKHLGDKDAGWRVDGVVTSVTYLGDTVRYEVAVGDDVLVAVTPDASETLSRGESVAVTVSETSLLPLN